MKRSAIRLVTVIALAAAASLAQEPGGKLRPGAPNMGERRLSLTEHLEHLTQVLDLTESQKGQARTIFEEAAQSAQPVQQELRQNREKLTAAAKAGNSDMEIEKLATQQGYLMGKLLSIHAMAMSKFYRILTPEQRAKADQTLEQFRQGVRPNSGP